MNRKRGRPKNRFESEAIGAMVYIAMAILKEREKTIK